MFIEIVDKMEKGQNIKAIKYQVPSYTFLIKITILTNLLKQSHLEIP